MTAFGSVVGFVIKPVKSVCQTVGMLALFLDIVINMAAFGPVGFIIKPVKSVCETVGIVFF